MRKPGVLKQERQQRPRLEIPLKQRGVNIPRSQSEGDVLEAVG